MSKKTYRVIALVFLTIGLIGFFRYFGRVTSYQYNPGIFLFPLLVAAWASIQSKKAELQ